MFQSVECSPLGAGVFSCSLKGLHRTLDKFIAVFFLSKMLNFFYCVIWPQNSVSCPDPDSGLESKHCLTAVNYCISGHHGGESKENLTPQEASGKFPS